MTKLRYEISRREVIAGAGALAMSSSLPSFAQSAMRTKPIPHSGEPLPVVGLGTSIVFQIGKDPNDRAERRDVLNTLVRGGGTLIDTASTYGSAESVVGDLVAEEKLRDKVFIATKGEVRSRAGMIAEFQESLQRLKTPKVDLMQLHNVSDPKQSLSLYREWKDAGLTRYIGITTSFNGDHDAVAACTAREKPDFVQVNYSITDRKAEKRVLPAAQDAGAAVLCNLPFGRGGLFRLVRGKPLPDWAAEFDAKTWAEFFLKFMISHEAVNAVIPGTSDAKHMQDNLGAGRGRLPDAAMRKRMAECVGKLK
ncbi:MAG TPA: aldo/keto reductase [Xanthobacteraceae bacterium]|nr:aldo/keto reductase [Xanthobacteraceae bacterium]